MLSPGSFDLAGSNTRFVLVNIFVALVILLWLVSLGLFVYEFFPCPPSVKKFKSLRNLNKLFIFSFSFVYVFTFIDECRCPQLWQWNIEIFVIFGAWINVIAIASELPLTGLYVLIFKEIVKTSFMIFFFFGILLVAAYTVVLFMMFHSPTASVGNCLHSPHILADLGKISCSYDILAIFLADIII